MTADDYPDWGALAALQTFITNLNLASQTLQATATEIADAIASAGTPLLGGFTTESSGTAALTASGTDTVTITPRGPGYQIGLFPTYHSSNGSNPFVQVTVSWLDPVTGNTLGKQNWVIAVGEFGGHQVVTGRGPVEGPELEIEFTNLDSAEAVDVVYNVQAMTQTAARHDWRQTGTVPVPGFSAGPGDGLGLGVTGLILGCGSGTTIAANGQLTYLLPLYAGMAGLNITADAGNFTARVEPALTDEEPATAYFNPKVADGTTVSELIVMPRQPCVANFANLSVTSAAEVTWSVLAMEYAS